MRSGNGLLSISCSEIFLTSLGSFLVPGSTQLKNGVRFSSSFELNPLQLEHVSQEKEFGSNLSRVGELMRHEWHTIEWDDELEMGMWNDLWVHMCEPSVRTSQQQQILANDIAFFKAPLETPGHQEVMKRICNHLVGIAGHVMSYCPELVKGMWIGGCPKNKQEMLIKNWKEKVSVSYCTLYDFAIVLSH